MLRVWHWGPPWRNGVGNIRRFVYVHDGPCSSLVYHRCRYCQVREERRDGREGSWGA